MYLAHRSDNDTGVCWPSEQRIAKDYDLSERTVVRAIAELQRSRLIKIVGQRSYPGKKPVSVYQINLKKLLKLAPDEEKAKLEYTLEEDFLSDITGLDREESHADPKPGITVADSGILDPKPGIPDPQLRLEGVQTQSLNSPSNSSLNSSPSTCTAMSDKVNKTSPSEIGQEQVQNQKQPQAVTQQDCQDLADAWWAIERHSTEEFSDETMLSITTLLQTENVGEVLNVLTWLPESHSWDKPIVVEGGNAKGVLRDFSEFCSLFPKIQKTYLHYMQRTPEKYRHKYIWKGREG